jgi:hypothetical protein
MARASGLGVEGGQRGGGTATTHDGDDLEVLGPEAQDGAGDVRRRRRALHDYPHLAHLPGVAGGPEATDEVAMASAPAGRYHEADAQGAGPRVVARF